MVPVLDLRSPDHDAARDAWFTRTPPDKPGAILLFCFPHAGAGASAFRRWPDRVGAGIAPIPVQLPGRESRFREAPLEDGATAAAAFVAAAGPLLRRPFALFGHSMGALLAFEVASRLAACDGMRPHRLFVSAARPPHLPDPEPGVADLPDDRLIASLKRWGGVSDEMVAHPDLLPLLLPTLRADLRLCALLCSGRPAALDIPITAIGGAADPKIRPDEIAAWGELTSAPQETRILDAGHFYLETRHAELADLIGRRLETVGAAA